MMILRSNALFLVLILGFSLTQIQSLRFEIESGHTKCISEEIKGHSMTVGKYHIINPNDGHPLPDTHKVTVRATSEHGNSYHYAENVHEGHFSFETVEAGDYQSCFVAADHKPPVKLTVDFEWKTGVAAKDWTNVAKKASVEAMELELKHMAETVQAIHDEMFYLREREEEMHDLNISTNDKMAWMTGLSILVCLSVAGLQFWHLKTFFEKKKLI
ncbi:transmembrane emp24 domain-containing protein p24delta7-like [Nicotiana tabacum]|uniref:Transmembrane emp24 domain-containing protein p24delta7-like n=2 Tax=Nicotiana TaxID=4085 RepID=A0A1S3ZAF5_TOBAC|nr:PREDICTED: transmembrane emp24 domain-containing protein p24delta7 [Nicotiana sylvestris]XP_016461207.1 PREDICTED: transmembrane emp24 domain-containing protein p24delta7-like [Nicotiana tabacum]